MRFSPFVLLLFAMLGCGSGTDQEKTPAKKVPDAAAVTPAPRVPESVQSVSGGTRRPGPANIFIAAAGSSARVKSRADYVCDGTDDHVEIQAAIDSLPEQSGEQFGVSGGTVELSAGSFRLGGAVQCHDKVVSLIGAGMSSTELTIRDGVNDDIVIVGTGTKQGWPSGRIAQLSLNGNGENQEKGSGIRVHAGLRLTIEHVRVSNCKETGIFLQGPSAEVRPAIGTIENCHIGYNRKHGVHIGAGIEGWIIRGNRINDNGTHGQPYHGVYVEAIHGKVESGPAGAANAFIIANNLLWQNRSIQICVNGGGYGGAHIVIAGNVMLSSPLENIKLYAGTHLVSVTGELDPLGERVGDWGGAPHHAGGRVLLHDLRECLLHTVPRPSFARDDQSGSGAWKAR